MKKRTAVPLIWAAVLLWTLAAPALAEEARLVLPPAPTATVPAETAPVDPPPAENGTAPTLVTLTEDLVVGPGETVSYITGGADMPDLALELGYLPYGLIFDAGGHRIVVQDGGSLSIRTLNYGGGDPRPTIRGVLSPEGLFRVEAGGVLDLSDVDLELEGEGLFVVQADGGVFENPDGLAPGKVQYGAPLVLRLVQPFYPLYLETGAPLDAVPLPASAPVSVLEAGAVRQTELSIAWTLSPTETGGLAVGTFLDEAGAPFLSAVAAEQEIIYYEPEAITLTGTRWLGGSAALALLSFTPLPAEAERLWGEVSEDGGVTWTEGDWELREDEMAFTLPDSTPRRFRVAAESADGARHWVSPSVVLPGADDIPSDQGGDRGGSSSPVVPKRTPAPTPEPSPTPEPTPRPTPEPTPSLTPPPGPTPKFMPTAAPMPEPAPTPLETLGPPVPPMPEVPAPVPSAQAVPAVRPGPVETPMPTVTARPSPTPKPAPETPAPTPAAEPVETPQPSEPPEPAQPPEPLAPPLQYVLGGAALLACLAAGAWAALRRR